MTYLLLFSYIYIYSYIIRTKQKVIDFLIAYIPVSVLLIMVIGLQYEVGTDYSSYYSLAEGTKGVGWIAGRSEYLFIGLVELIKKTGQPQLLFVFAGAIQVTFITLIAYEIKKLGYKMHDFFFLYFTLSLTFFNQFNGIRQYIAVYIVIYAFLKLINNKKVIFATLIMISGLIHSSSMFFLPFMFLGKMFKKKLSVRKVTIFMGLVLIVASLDLTKYIELLLSYTSYKSYIGSSYFGRMSLQAIITKIPKLIIVFISLFIISKRVLKDKEVELINLGYLGIFVLIMSFSSSLIWRFYQYVDLLIILPVLIMFNDERYKTYKTLISLALFAMLIIKIIVMPQGEYLYRSILFVN